MTVVHAVWTGDDRLQLWGERPLAGGGLPRPKGRAPRDGRPRRHPYAAPEHELRAALGELTTLELVAEVPAVEAMVVLPSGVTSPLPSPDLPGVSDAGEAPVDLRSWRTDALEVVGADALTLLLALPSHPPAGARPGASLTTVGAVAALALEFAARGQVLPGLIAHDGRFEARWLPALDHADRRRLAVLATALPPALLAAAAEEHRSPGSVLRDMVEQFVDAACRTALAGQRLATSRGRRSVEQAWVHGLTASDPAVVHADTGGLQLLAKEVDAWHGTGEGTAPLRAAFRLVPPATHADAPTEHAEDADADGQPVGAPAWRLEFALQATDDPSLIVTAADVWGSERTLRFLDRALEAPEERLLADLGRASRLYPGLDRALDTARPESLELQLDEVLDFLRDTVPLLDQAGFGVLLPDELRRPARLGARLKTTARPAQGPRAEASGLLGYEGILDYRWEIAVGDHSLSADELYELARLKAPLVRLRGLWVELREDDLAAALRLLEDRSTGQMTVAEAARVGLGVTDPGIGLELVGVDADGPLGALLDGDADQRLEALGTPEGLQGTLRAYQERGLSWLAFLDVVGLGGCLADDMGLGKSIQLLALLVHERAGIGRRAKRWPAPTLLVCPMSIVGNWGREAARFAPDLRVHVHHGRERLAGDAFGKEVRRSDLVITTYSLAARDRDELAACGWRRIVLDEAQNIKNPAAKQTRAIRALDAPQRLALTGTPVENRLSELWSIMDFCNPGLLGTQTAFRETFAVPIEKLHDDEAAARLRRLTRPFVLRRKKTDRSIAPDLPDKIEFDEGCNLTREQASLYGAVVEDMLAKVEASEGIERRGLVLQTMLRLKQVCNHPAHLLADGSRLPGRSGKLNRLDELVDEVLASGEKTLVFTQFAQWGARLQAHLRERLGREVLYLHGSVARADRDRMVDAFQAESGPGVFVLSLKAGGVGLNLTAANHVIHYDRWWNPAVEDQATDRAFRIGQRRDVVVRKLVCTGTLEERIAELIERKKDLAERVVGTGEGWLTELSTDELRRVVALSADAVAE
ncbi:MAG TPA: DEAD/DEAH box helicase [Nitriliruptorales bacterium]